MKRILLIMSIFSVVPGLFLGGCREQAGSDASMVGENVTLTGTDTFPPELAGRWRDDLRKWEIVLAEDGSVTEAVVAPMGWPTLYPDQRNVIDMREGGEGAFAAGPWYVDYDAREMTLTVEIVLESFDVEVGNTRLVGSSRDIFQGSVTPDHSTWKADWFNIPVMKVVADGREHPLPVDPEDMAIGLEFHKVADKKPSE